MGVPLLAADAQAPRAPGTLASHYAPAARLRLWAPDALSARLAASALHAGEILPARLAVYSRRAGDAGAAGERAWARMPDDAQSAAHELFAVLRRFDADDATEIWVAQPPDTPDWHGVTDRLRRAATP